MLKFPRPVGARRDGTRAPSGDRGALWAGSAHFATGEMTLRVTNPQLPILTLPNTYRAVPITPKDALILAIPSFILESLLR